MPTIPTSAVKVNAATGVLVDPIAATFAAANGFLTGGTSDAKDSVRLATTGAITLASRTSSTLTTAASTLTLDGSAVVNGDAVLVKNAPTGGGGSAADCGIFTVSGVGTTVVLTRRSDFDAWTEIVGAFVSVEAGTVNAGTQWLCNVVAGGTIGTTAITFVVPKNFVDLTTNQTVGGNKYFGPNGTFGGVQLSKDGVDSALNAQLQFLEDDSVVLISASSGYLWMHTTGNTDVTFPLSGTLLSTDDSVTGSGDLVRGTSPTITTSLLCANASFTAFAGATTLLTIGGAGTSASMFAPSTLDATSSTTGAIRTSGGISAAKALNIGTTGTFGGQIVTIAGAVGTPSIAPTGDSNTGIWFPAADKIAASVAGVRALTIEVGGTTSRLGLNSTSPSGTFHIVKDSASSVPFRISNAANTEHLDCYPPTNDGINTAAAWGTTSNHNFGIFTNNSGWWAIFTIDKYLRFPSGAGGLGIKNADGTVSIPGYTFESDTNTGMYRIGADQIGFAANGVLQLTINTTGITAAGTLAVTGATTLTGNLTSNGALISTPQALTTAAGTGAVNLTTLITEVTTTGILDALTLANGTAGQIKTIIHKAGAFTSVLTPTTALGFTSITFLATLGQSCTLQYTSAGWVILAVGGLTLPVIA